MIQEQYLNQNIFRKIKIKCKLPKKYYLFKNELKNIFNKIRKNFYIKKKKVDNKIKSNNKRFRVLFELAPDGIITLNRLGIITSANKAYYNLTGYEEKDIIGKHMFKINAFRKENMTKYAKMFTEYIRGVKPDSIEFTYIHKNGSIRWAEASFAFIENENNGKEIIVILREMTERKEKDIKLSKMMNELERSNRELDDYTFAVSHDLKAPLRTIDSFSNFILEDYADRLDDVGKEYLTRIRSAAQRMKILIDDLLTISRIGRKFMEFEPIDLNELIISIIKDNEIVMLENNCEIIYDKLPTIISQRVWIKQVFSNLISNGFKFNKSLNPTIWINYEEKEDVYLFSVKDNGIGIDKKHEDKLFALFQRLHTQEEYPGSGAGLMICKKVIESLGGKIWYESEINKGTTFYFTILKNQNNNDLVYDQTNRDQINNIENPLQ